MALKRVSPGQLITANDFNALIDAWEDHERRLAALERAQVAQSRQIVIDSPTEGTTVRAGQLLDVRGANFGRLANTFRLFFDSIEVNAFDGERSDGFVRVTVPAQLVAPSGGRTLALLVSNGTSTATRTLFLLLAAPTPGGTLSVSRNRFLSPDPNPILPGQAVHLPYTLAVGAVLNEPTPFQITVNSTPAVSAASVTLVDGQRNPLDNNQVVVAPGMTTVTFNVRLAAAPSGASFKLAVSAAAGGLSDFTEDTYNLNTATANDLARVDERSSEPANIFEAATRTLRVPRGTPGTLRLSVGFLAQGTYTVSVAVGNGWQTAISDPDAPSTNQLVVQYAAPAPPPGGESTVRPSVDVLPGTNATSAALSLTIQRAGVATVQIITYRLEVAS